MNTTTRYIFLSPGDRIQEGDEYFNTFTRQWKTSHDIGHYYCDQTITYRRQLNPRQQYEFLGPTNTLVYGDEHFNIHTNRWEHTLRCGETIGDTDTIYRRKVG